MDQQSPHLAQHLLFLLACFISLFVCGSATGFFKVHRKYSGQMHRISDLREHDARHHGRFLADATDLPLGGLGLPTSTGLYYTQIGIGTPSKPYYVQVDTGSDILWVNCITCKHCPRKSDLGIELTLYDPNGSSSGSLVSCDESFCSSTYGGEIPGCVHEVPCQYNVLYGDGSSTAGYFVTDYVQYNQVSGNHQTTTANASISFGCGAQQSGDLVSSSEAVGGILGFGQSNSSMLSQLAAAGKVRKIFAHCLDTVKGGGIFAIGNVVQPKVMTTPLVPDMLHYNVILKSVQVGGASLKLPTGIFETGDKKGTILDSGTTLAYLPEGLFKPLMNAIFSYQPNLSFQTIQDFQCFRFSGSSSRRRSEKNEGCGSGRRRTRRVLAGGNSFPVRKIGEDCRMRMEKKIRHRREGFSLQNLDYLLCLASYLYLYFLFFFFSLDLSYLCRPNYILLQVCYNSGFASGSTLFRSSVLL